jgi:hypothetical protein
MLTFFFISLGQVRKAAGSAGGACQERAEAGLGHNTGIMNTIIKYE